MKTYTLNTENISGDLFDEQKTIIVSEEKTETTETRITIAQLKEKFEANIKQIENLKKENDEIIDEINLINTNIKELNIQDIPEKQ